MKVYDAVKRNARISCLPLAFLFCFTTGYGQDTPSQQKISHRIKGGMGYGKGEYFSGLSGMLAYDLYYKNYFISASYIGFEEFVLVTFGGNTPLDNINDINLTLNRDFTIGRATKVSIGSGVSYSRHVISNDKIIERATGQPSTDYDQTKFNRISVPADLSISIRRKYRLHPGLQLHTVWTKADPYYTVNLWMGYAFHRITKR